MIIAIVIPIVLCFVALILLVKFLGCIILLYGAMLLLVWFIVPLRSFFGCMIEGLLLWLSKPKR